MEEKNTIDPTVQDLNVMASPERLVPKLVTNINFGKTKDGGVVMTLFTQPPGEKNPPVLLETVYLEKTHAKEAIKVLNEVIESKNE